MIFSLQSANRPNSGIYEPNKAILDGDCGNGF